MGIKFTDVRPEFIGSEPYVCPNECLATLHKLMEKVFYSSKGGSIASGGEVPLTVILPNVDELKIVDHNYGSLFWTCTKILMIKNLTNEEIAKTFDNITLFTKLVKDFLPDNPISQTKHSIWGSTLSMQWPSLQKYWKEEIPPRLINKAREKLDQVEVIHGDLRDLGTGIDLLYISNALGHRPHDGQLELHKQLHHVIAFGGNILSTNSHGLEGCTQVKVEKEITYHSGWVYDLHRKLIPFRFKPTEKFHYTPEPKVLKTLDVYNHYSYPTCFKFLKYPRKL